MFENWQKKLILVIVSRRCHWPLFLDPSETSISQLKRLLIIAKCFCCTLRITEYENCMFYFAGVLNLKLMAFLLKYLKYFLAIILYSVRLNEKVVWCHFIQLPFNFLFLSWQVNTISKCNWCNYMHWTTLCWASCYIAFSIYVVDFNCILQSLKVTACFLLS